MGLVTIKIDGKPIQVEEGMSVLQAARQVQLKIPALCYHPDLPAWAACGICVVKVEKSPKMMRACALPVSEGLSVITNDPELVEVRRSVLQLILASHPQECLTCMRNQNCELQRLSAEFGIRDIPFEMHPKKLPKDESTTSIVLDPSKCVLCGRCVSVCQGMQNVWALEFLSRGDQTRIAPAGDIQLDDSPCIKCGQCAAHCPVGAIYEKDETALVWKNLMDVEKHCSVQIAPAVRVALGEAFGLEPGTLTTGKIYTALKMLGFKAVFDTNFGADLTIMEEGSELVERLTKHPDKLPLITTCCPAWVDYLEKYFPDIIPNFSTAKSPQAMVGALTKTYYAQKMGIDPAKMFHVSVMPCTAKKYEVQRDQTMRSSGFQDIDCSITTRELARMIKQAGIDFLNLPDTPADDPLGEYTGAGTIFGVTGGVMEAAVRTAHYLLTNQEMGDINFTPVRGIEGIKEATLQVAGRTVRIAVAHQMGNIQTVLERVLEAQQKGEELPYHFIEVMACRGGCVGGGGQPYGATDEIRLKRAQGIYKDDSISKERCSHKNGSIQKLYKEFLGHPLSEKSHKLLHTHYVPRPLYRK